MVAVSGAGGGVTGVTGRFNDQEPPLAPGLDTRLSSRRGTRVAGEAPQAGPQAGAGSPPGGRSPGGGDPAPLPSRDTAHCGAPASVARRLPLIRAPSSPTSRARTWGPGGLHCDKPVLSSPAPWPLGGKRHPSISVWLLAPQQAWLGDMCPKSILHWVRSHLPRLPQASRDFRTSKAKPPETHWPVRGDRSCASHWRDSRGKVGAADIVQRQGRYRLFILPGTSRAQSAFRPSSCRGGHQAGGAWGSDHRPGRRRQEGWVPS